MRLPPSPAALDKLMQSLFPTPNVQHGSVFALTSIGNGAAQVGAVSELQPPTLRRDSRPKLQFKSVFHQGRNLVEAKGVVAATVAQPSTSYTTKDTTVISATLQAVLFGCVSNRASRE